MNVASFVTKWLLVALLFANLCVYGAMGYPWYVIVGIGAALIAAIVFIETY